MDRQIHYFADYQRTIKYCLTIFLLLFFLSCVTTPKPTHVKPTPQLIWYESYGFNTEQELIQIENIPKLQKALSDTKFQVRQKVVNILGKIGPPAKNIIPDLIRLLKTDEDPRVRRDVTVALWQISPDTKDVVNALSEAVHDDNTFVKSDVIRILSQSMEHDDVATNVLIYFIESDNSYLKLKAIEALSQKGIKSSRALPALVKCLYHKNDEIHTATEKALAKIAPSGNDKIISVLIDSLSSGNLKSAERLKTIKAIGEHYLVLDSFLRLNLHKPKNAEILRK